MVVWYIVSEANKSLIQTKTKSCTFVNITTVSCSIYIKTFLLHLASTVYSRSYKPFLFSTLYPKWTNRPKNSILLVTYDFFVHNPIIFLHREKNILFNWLNSFRCLLFDRQDELKKLKTSLERKIKKYMLKIKYRHLICPSNIVSSMITKISIRPLVTRKIQSCMLRGAPYISDIIWSSYERS